MSDKIRVTVTSESLVTTAGETVETIATLQNLGQTIDQLTMSIEGIDASWYTLPVSSVALFPNDKDNLRVVVSPPKTPEIKAGTYPFQIEVASQASPHETATVDLTLEIQTLSELEVSISPQHTTGRRGVYQLVVNNPGDSEAQLHLEVNDIHGALRYHLETTSLAIPSKDSTQTTLEVSLGWLSFFGGNKEFDFQVVATLPEVEEVKTVEGKLERIAWHRMLRQMRLPSVQTMLRQMRLPSVQTIDGRLVHMPWYRAIRRIRLPRIVASRLQRPPVIDIFQATTDDRIEFKLSWSVKRSKVIKLNDEIVDRQGETILVPTATASYVLEASNKYGSSTKVVEVQPRLVPQAKTSERIRVSLSSAEVKIQVGSTPEIVTVRLENLGEIVDKFTVEVEGIDESWYSRSASSIALMPQASEQVQITFQPPKKRGVKERNYPFAVIVRSQSTPDDATIIIGQIEVLPLVEYQLKVAPYRVSTRRKGKYRVNLANTGMSETQIYLEATDLDEGLLFKFNNEEPVVATWQSMEIPMIAKPKRGSVVGERKRYDIAITAKTVDGNTQTVNCEMHHHPFMASWRPVYRLIKTLIILSILGVVIFYILKLGGGWQVLYNSPQTWVDQLIRTVEGWFFR